MKNIKIFLTQYPSISLIKNEITNRNNFKFEPVSLSDIELDIRLLNPQKSNNTIIFLQKYENQVLRLQLMFFFHRLFNETITKGVFLDSSKLGDVTPVF